MSIIFLNMEIHRSVEQLSRMTQQKRLEWDQRAEVSRISLGYGGRRPVNRTKPSDETEWGWGREWKPLLLYSEPPGLW